MTSGGGACWVAKPVSPQGPMLSWGHSIFLAADWLWTVVSPDAAYAAHTAIEFADSGPALVGRATATHITSCYGLDGSLYQSSRVEGGEAMIDDHSHHSRNAPGPERPGRAEREGSAEPSTVEIAGAYDGLSSHYMSEKTPGLIQLDRDSINLARWIIYEPDQAESTRIGSVLTAALKKFYELNSNLPDRVIFYRDGVGDGQLGAVLEHEIPQVLDTFKNLGADYKPKVAWIVVKKRINTRFFAQAGRGLQNPAPGTVVDTEVTRPEWYDFFLVSQSVRQGTVTPCHYNVVWDTSGLKPDHMQRLTYKLCHLYYNWPGTIRVPAPCQYAHKLAFLVGQSIHKAPSLNLADRLYFL
ncbi:Piwi-like protein 1 [Branchiostoma belcheri]|nr:Piwi-like protein 1 [Branchiostoma belcheri]